jgi:hypothetical protein
VKKCPFFQFFNNDIFTQNRQKWNLCNKKCDFLAKNAIFILFLKKAIFAKKSFLPNQQQDW